MILVLIALPFFHILFDYFYSTLEGASQFGALRRYNNESNIFSVERDGLHFYSIGSCSLSISYPGLCNILIFTKPSFSIFGWNISDIIFISGGLLG